MVLAMQPRLLITLVQDENNPENLKQVNVSVRVGQAVDVVAQAGKPKTITGFQTHTTPVLLAYGERAELANDECKSIYEPYSCWLLLCLLFLQKSFEELYNDEEKVVQGEVYR